jgi:hypothetical protein
MSSALRISVIAEGVTDKIVLDAFLEAVLGHANFVTSLIQPETSRAFGHAGEHGGGWKGVAGKCLEIRRNGGVERGGYLANVHAMIIHLDGEVAEEPEVNCTQPCPPPASTADALREKVWSWIGESYYDPRVIVAIPMKETEAWVFAALRPNDKLFILCNEERRPKTPPCLECRDKPSNLMLGGSPRLKKSRPAYENVQRALVEGFHHARALSQVQQFEQDVRAAVAMSSLLTF